MNAPLNLFSDDPLNAFEGGLAKFLIANRNSNLGSLLNSERAVYYTQILYRMLLFRRGHELEPLHDDLYYAVQAAQQAVSGQDYGWELFNQDITQLIHWNLLSSRMEKERIRGYKDTRKTKYRYSLPDETIAFLHWLEERLQDDFTERSPDARDLLEDICGTVKELGRLIRLQWREEMQEGAARRILFQIVKARQITLEIGSGLGDFNARLMGFLMRDYQMEELRELIASLSDYVEKYLKQVGQYREALLPQIKKLKRPKYIQVLSCAFDIMEKERRTAPQLFRSMRERVNPTGIPTSLYGFYCETGALDGLCRRINKSALLVWRRMSAHLKELERKSHRLADLRIRIEELAGRDAYDVPEGWLNGFLSWGHMRGDMHEWSEDVLANPPLPRRSSWKTARSPSLCLKPKSRGGGVSLSMEEARLELLKAWLVGKLPELSNGRAHVSRGAYNSREDFSNILELAKKGILNEGKKLRRAGFTIEPTKTPASVAIEKQQLKFFEMILEKHA